MMPELYLSRRARRGRQAAVPRAHRRLGRRLDDDRRVATRAGRHPQARAHGRVREAVRERGDVGAVAADPVPTADARRCRRLLRAAHPLVHAPLEGARPHRHPRRAQGPPERAEEPVRPPARPRHHVRVDRAVDDAVGPDPLRGDVPVVRRRVRARARGRRTRCRGPRPPAWVLGTAMRSEPTMSADRDPVLPLGGIQCARRRVPAGRHHRPAPPDRLRRDVRAVLVVRADVAREPRSSPTPGEGWRMVEDGATQMDGDLPGEHERRRAVVEPDRRAAACSGSPRRRCRCGARPASTRSTAPRSRSATPTAAARSSSPCGSSAPTSRDRCECCPCASATRPGVRSDGVSTARSRSSAGSAGQGEAEARRFVAEGREGRHRRRARRRGRSGRRRARRRRRVREARRDVRGGVAGGGRLDRRRVRRAARAREQRRRPRRVHAVGADVARRLHAGHQHQPRRHVPRHAHRRASDARQRRRLDRQHLVDRGHVGRAVRRRLHREQVRRARASRRPPRSSSAATASASTPCIPGEWPPR